MTAPDLAELRRLLEASSPGEWSIDPAAHDWEAGIRDADHRAILDSRTREDAELIVAMRNALTPLLDRIEAAETRAQKHAQRIADLTRGIQDAIVEPINRHWQGVVEAKSAEAWDECAEECYLLGWTHDDGRDDMKARNPYRPSDPSQPPLT